MAETDGADTYLLDTAGPSPAQAPEVLIAALDPPCYDSDVEEFEQRLNNTMASMMTQLAALQARPGCMAVLAAPQVACCLATD